MPTPRFAAITSMIALAAISRLVPHPWNVTPIAAMALFGGAHFADRRLAFLIPAAAMMATDLFLGWHGTLPFVYAGFAAIVLIGRAIRGRLTTVSVGGGALAGTLLFFLITNFGHWLIAPEYPKTLAGLAACYTAAIPFFRNMLAGDLFYTAALFGSLALAQRRFAVLREAPAH